MKTSAVVIGVLSLLVVFSFSTDVLADTKSEFNKLDANRDGKLSLEEYTKKLGGKEKKAAGARFKKADKNNDGFLVYDEFKNIKKDSGSDKNVKNIRKKLK